MANYLLKTIIVSILMLLSFTGSNAKENLSDIHFKETEQIYSLTGQWKYTSEDDLYFADPEYPDESWSSTNIPGQWNTIQNTTPDLKIAGQQKPIIWYRKRFFGSEAFAERQLAIYFPFTDVAREVYLNGKLIGKNGSIGPNGELLEIDCRSDVYEIPKGLFQHDKPNLISIRVRGMEGVGGVILKDFYIGSSDLIKHKFTFQIVRYGLYTSIFLFTGFFFLLIYLMGKRDPVPLIISLLSISFGSFIASFHSIGFWLFDSYWINSVGIILPTLFYPPLFLKFFQLFFNTKKSAFIRFASFYSLINCGVFIVSLFKNEWYSAYLLGPYQLFLIFLPIASAYGIYVAYNATKKKLTGSRYILIGFSLCNAGIFINSLSYLFPQLFNYIDAESFMIFTVSLAVAFSKRVSEIQKRMEQLTEHLQEEVSIKTKELTNSNLKLIEMDRLKTDFFANITHELRTPLTLSMVPLEQLITEEKEPKRAGLLQMIQKNNFQLLSLINELLDISKIDAGGIQLQKKNVDYILFLQKILDYIEPPCKLRQIDVKFIHPESKIIAFIDPLQFEKIVLNLLSNAIKFTEPGGTITLSISQDEKENRVSLNVSDQGPGIPSSELENIFNRFHQVASSHGGKKIGTGIGLSLAKDLSQLHDGSLSVKNNPEKGCTFTVNIPLNGFGENNSLASISDIKPVSAAPYNTTKIVSIGKSETEQTDYTAPHDALPKFTVLVVDDNSDMRALIHNTLSKNYHVVTAENGKEGLEKAINIKPNLILSDVIMPEMDGYEFCSKLRKDNRTKKIPFVMLSAMEDFPSKLKGFDAGIDDYLNKPFHPRELESRINNLLNKQALENNLNLQLKEIERDIDRANSLMQKLLPTNIEPHKKGKIGVLYKPMQITGGDFYDIFPHDRGMGIFLCDVTGHGIEAAFITAMLKVLIQKITDGSPVEPHILLSHLNSHISENIGNNFITAVCCDFDFENKKLKYATAGHFPPVIFRKDEIKQPSPSGKPCIGILPSVKYHSQEYDILPGDRILLFTDGIEESAQKETTFGQEKFFQIMSKNRALTPEKALNNLWRELQDFSGPEKPQNDDILTITVDFL